MLFKITFSKQKCCKKNPYIQPSLLRMYVETNETLGDFWRLSEYELAKNEIFLRSRGGNLEKKSKI